MKRHRSVLKWLLLVMVIGFVGQFVWSSDLEVISDYLKQMPGTFTTIIGLSLGAYLSATLAWRFCMGDEGSRTSLYELFMIRHVGEVLSVFNPTSVIAGETLKAHYLAKNSISSSTAVSSILLSRILIILSAILLMVLSSLYLAYGAIDGGGSLPLVILAGIVVVGFGYLLARFLLHSKLYLHRTVLRLQRRFGDRFLSDALLASLYEVNHAAHTFYHKHRASFMLAFALSILHWILGAAEFYVILRTLGFDLSVVNAMAIEMGVIFFKTVGAIVPGQVGVEEYANKVMLGAVGIVSNEVWLVVSIMRRARQLFWVVIAALFYLILRRTGEVAIDIEGQDPSTINPDGT